MSWTYVQYFISFFNRKWFFGECSSRRSSQLKEMESPSSFLHDFLSNILYFNFNSNTFGNNSSNKGSWCMSKKSWSILLTIWNGSGLHGHTVVKIWINLMYHQLRFLDFFFISLWILDIYLGGMLSSSSESRFKTIRPLRTSTAILTFWKFFLGFFLIVDTGYIFGY